MSPDGKLFMNRRAAVKFLIENKHPQELIEAMLECLVTNEGWKEDKDLPLRWYYKTYKPTNRRREPVIAFLMKNGTEKKK